MSMHLMTSSPRGSNKISWGQFQFRAMYEEPKNPKGILLLNSNYFRLYVSLAKATPKCTILLSVMLDFL